MCLQVTESGGDRQEEPRPLGPSPHPNPPIPSFWVAAPCTDGAPELQSWHLNLPTHFTLENLGPGEENLPQALLPISGGPKPASAVTVPCHTSGDT